MKIYVKDKTGTWVEPRKYTSTRIDEVLNGVKETTLHLTLKKKWFDMILKGIKKQEYRELKAYWMARLTNQLPFKAIPVSEWTFKEFDTIRFYNGGSPSLKYPNFTIECKGISIGPGNSDWGAPEGNVFIIDLGEIKTNNAI